MLSDSCNMKTFFLKSIPCGIFCIEHTFDIFDMEKGAL